MFYAQNPALEIIHQQKSVNVYLHIHTCTTAIFSKNPLCAESCVTKDVHISPPVLVYDFLSRCKFSTLTSTPMYSSRFHAQNSVLEIVHEESVKVYSTHVIVQSRTLVARVV